FDLLFNLAQSKAVSPTLIPIDFIVDDMKVKSVIGGNPVQIPPLYWDVIAESWRARDPSLYGRMDFAWCGNAPVKLLEYNAD
ncbi:glutathionylspermidine synthase family protein, partial [Escherichia coli]|uniref:glutathionylspermidine synthase family protein n=1 Tax=Escherichia coli TaxID=562 RepID=UPI003EDF81E4